MLSKEEIEKAKMTLKDMDSFSLTDYNALNILLQYIDQLEQEAQALKFIKECDTDRINQLEQENKKQNKIIDEMAEWLIGFTFSDKKELEAIFYDKKQVKQYFEKKVEEN